MGLFSQKNAPLIGLDISSTAVKLLELSKQDGRGGVRYRVESYAVEPLPSTAVVEKNIADVDAADDAEPRLLRLLRATATHNSRLDVMRPQGTP